MSPSLFHVLNISQTAMLSQLKDLDITSDNLANSNTVGYRANRANFQEMLNSNLQEGVRVASTQFSLSQGSLTASDSSLSLALEGEGFFAVTLPDDTVAYTRNGQFMLDGENQIVDTSGNPLVWDGAIPEEAENIVVSETGVVSVEVDSTWSEAGTIPIYRFNNPTALSSYGSTLYLPSLNSGDPIEGTAGSDTFGSIQSQYLESSNVNLSNEMTHLVELQRAFQMTTNVFDNTDTMISLAINLRKG